MNKRIARIAGLLYLIVLITGIFSLVYVPSQISNGSGALTEVSNIHASISLFRLGVLSELTQYTAMLFLMYPLYKLLRPVNKHVAMLMVMLAIAFSAVGHKLDVLSLLTGNKLHHALTTDQSNVQAMLALAGYHNELLLSEIFWGLWLFPFGYLVFKSGFLPKILGILLMVGCFSYLADFFSTVMGIAMPSYFMLPAAISEIGTCLWLLIMGQKTKAHDKVGRVSPNI